MKWRKKGLIYTPNKSMEWAQYYGMMPTPEYIPDRNVLKIYFGTTDQNRIGRTTILEVDSENPSIVITKIQNQLIKPGKEGNFDDSGVIPSSIINYKNLKFLYYVGFQRCYTVPYMLFPGLAISKNQGDSFERFSNAPIIDRNNKYYVSFAAPTVLIDGEVFKMWLWIGIEWTTINAKKYIKAKIGYAESVNGKDWEILSDSCINIDEKTEFSVGRPSVIKNGNLYKMWYSIRYIDKLYRIGYAESLDGINWIRKDNEVGIDVSETGWDSEMICYPAVIKVKEKTFMFYNGNNNGETGFGYAELVED